jgi:hypothetical protein
MGDESDIDLSVEMVIGSNPTFMVAGIVGVPNVVSMKCTGKHCSVLLDSRAVKSVVGSRYLSKFYSSWEKYLLTKDVGSFHRANGALHALELVVVQLQLADLEMFMKC